MENLDSVVILAGPAQEHRLRRDQHARQNNAEPFPQRAFLGWELPEATSPAAATKAVTQLFALHEQLRIRIGSQDDPLRLSLVDKPNAVNISHLASDDFLQEQRELLNRATAVGEPAARAYINIDGLTGRLTATIIVDTLVCDGHSLRVLDEQFERLLITPSTEVPEDRIGEYIRRQWEATARYRDEAISYYRERTYAGSIASPLPLIGATVAPSWRASRVSGHLSDSYNALLHGGVDRDPDFVTRLLNDLGQALREATGEERNGIGFAVANRGARYWDTVGWLANTLPLQLPAPRRQDEVETMAQIRRNLRTVHRWKYVHISQVIDIVEGRGNEATSRQVPSCFISIEIVPKDAAARVLKPLTLQKDRAYRGVSMWLGVDEKQSNFVMSVGHEVDPQAVDAFQAQLCRRGWVFEA